MSSEPYLPIDRTKLSKSFMEDPSKQALRDESFFEELDVTVKFDMVWFRSVDRKGQRIYGCATHCSRWKQLIPQQTASRCVTGPSCNMNTLFWLRVLHPRYFWLLLLQNATLLKSFDFADFAPKRQGASKYICTPKPFLISRKLTKVRLNSVFDCMKLFKTLSTCWNSFGLMAKQTRRMSSLSARLSLVSKPQLRSVQGLTCM